MFAHAQRDSSQDIHEKFDMLAQFYQPGSGQGQFDNMYDNINLENVGMRSNNDTNPSADQGNQ